MKRDVRDGVVVEQMAIFEKRESQCKSVLKYMQKHGSCSLFSNFGRKITRIPARIKDLEKAGYTINHSIRKHHENGSFCFNYAEYRLVIK
jgi:hypothetical protein